MHNAAAAPSVGVACLCLLACLLPSTRLTLKLNYAVRDISLYRAQSHPEDGRGRAAGVPHSPLPLPPRAGPLSLSLSRSFREIFLPHLKSLLPGARRAGQEEKGNMGSGGGGSTLYNTSFFSGVGCSSGTGKISRQER